MIDFTGCNIEQVAVHSVGNRTNGDDLFLSNQSLDISNPETRELLFEFFLGQKFSSGYFSFTFSNENFKLNPLFAFASDIFNDLTHFQKKSKDIAKHLFEVSSHPQIKSGDLFISYVSRISLGNRFVDAIGIFKSENTKAFLKLDKLNDRYSIYRYEGMSIDKLDKGCLILNTEKQSGYRVCILDRSSKSIEAQYWRDIFLNLKSYNDEYYQTSEFLKMTKEFVATEMKEFNVDRADQIDLMNRSIDYFKKNEVFDRRDFEKRVFQDSTLIKSFRSFDLETKKERNLELEENFEISSAAVKKQSRIFRSVLKLDKNFHIYIHGNREMIQQGIEKDGRKYYKIYFEEES